MERRFIPEKPDTGEPQILILDEKQSIKCTYLGLYRGKESNFGGYYHHIRTCDGLDFIIYPFANLTKQLKHYRVGTNLRIQYICQVANKYGTNTRVFSVEALNKRWVSVEG